MRRDHGWVSVPVLLMVLMLSVLLVRHQRSLSEERLWQTQRALQQPQLIWQEIYQHLSSMSAVAGDKPDCTGFCDPKNGGWQMQQFASGVAWLQKQRIDLLQVERWCATRDQQQVRCWWHFDSGEQTMLWLEY